MKDEVAKARHELIEKIAENDDVMMADYLDGKELRSMTFGRRLEGGYCQ